MSKDLRKFSELLELQAEKFGDRVALLFENGNLYDHEELTYRQLRDGAFKLAFELRKRGYREGDSIALVMRNHPEFIYLVGAAFLLGIVLVPIDPRIKGERLEYIFNDAGCKGAVATADLMPEVEKTAGKLERVRDLFLNLKPDASKDQAEKHETLQSMLEGSVVEDLDRRVENPLLPLQVLYTSGVTGPPKGVVQRGIQLYGYSRLAAVWPYGEDDILYTGLSLAHGNAQSATLFPALFKGIKAVISQKFTKTHIWDVCRKYGCTSFSLLGGMMAGIYNEPPRENDADNPVRIVLSAGTPRNIWESFEKRFGVKIMEWYGTVEGGFACKPAGQGPIGSFGKPLPGAEMKIVDEQDREMPPHQIGELVFRQVDQQPVVHYLNSPEASQEKTRGGWLRTGDMCYRDEEGWLFFAFRKGKSLRRSGDFIQPDSVEKVIGEHPDVTEVCVYGIPAASGAPGESDLVAAVAPFPGKTIDPSEVFQICRRSLERNAIPSYMQVVEEIPKSVSEKHLDNVLRGQFDPDAENVYRLEE